MGWNFCWRPSKLHFWKVGISTLQAIQNYEKWWGSLHAIAQHTTTNVKHVEVYYECLLKLTNCLQVRAIDVFLTIVFKTSLLLYLILAITSMKRNTLIEHKEAIVICEENGPISLNYNVWLTTLKADIITNSSTYW
jgi:hypothetical protein